MEPVYALFVHGVGEQEADFAEDSRQHLRKALAERGQQLYASTVHWAPIADKLQHAFLRRVEKRGSKGNMLQKLFVGTLADALVYQSTPSLVAEIHALMDAQYVRLRGPNIHIFAHSLGGLVVTDWLRSRRLADVTKLHTFGCNIGLFNLGKAFDCPWQLQRKGKWVNYFDSADMLGFALGEAHELSHVKDVEVSVGGWFTGWTGLAHIGYFGDRSLWRKTIPRHIP